MKYGDSKLSKILNKTGGKCYYCGVPLSGERSFPGDDRPGAWNVDHLFPDGRNDLANLVPACVLCNSRKGFMQPDDFFRLIGKRAPRGRPRSWAGLVFKVLVCGLAVYGARRFYLDYLREDPWSAFVGEFQRRSDAISRSLQSSSDFFKK